MSLLVQPQPRDVVGFSQENHFVGVGVSVLRGLCVEEEEESEWSSSIGVGGESDDDDDDDGGEEEVESKAGKDSFESLDSLEDSLPIKRGLSNFFNGKSKSFASLSEAAETTTSASDLAKPENPFNKRRRIVMACKSSWKRRASCTSLLHPLKETQREEEKEGENEKTPTGTCLDAFRSPQMRCFSLYDLNRHDECD